MIVSHNKILIICLSLLVAFAPIPSLASGYASNKDAPCSMGMGSMDIESVEMKSMHRNGDGKQQQAKQQNTNSSKHCDNCKQGGHSCQQCDCNMPGCFVSKVQYFSQTVIPPRLIAQSSTQSLSKSHPPHSRLTPPLLRPPIKHNS